VGPVPSAGGVGTVPSAPGVGAVPSAPGVGAVPSARGVVDETDDGAALDWAATAAVPPASPAATITAPTISAGRTHRRGCGCSVTVGRVSGNVSFRSSWSSGAGGMRSSFMVILSAGDAPPASISSL
jgi:hypothetical protein